MPLDKKRTFDSPPQNLIRAAALLLILPVAGTLGYMVIEGWPFLDALYMTVITLTTVGFREVHPLDDSGKVFTMLLTVVGVGAIFYALISLFQFLLEGELGTLLGVRRMKGQIDRLTNHYILCGFGRVGEEIAREFMARAMPFVIIEQTDEAIERAQRRGYLVLVGDATNDDILREAGVARARCLLAASDSDAGNTFIVLTAKALNPDVYVVARAAHPESQPRLLRAGADRVFSPYIIAGRQMAISALQPMVVEFIDTLGTGDAVDRVLAEIEISEESGLAGRTVEDVISKNRTIIVMGLHKANGDVVVGPAMTSTVNVGDRIIVMGRESELEALSPGRTPVRAEPTS